MKYYAARLEQHGVTPDAGEIMVTGASGGVGSLAVAILARLGYQVVASTGRAETHKYLRRLGAGRIVDRTALGQLPDRPLASAQWAGAVDVVGGDTLAALLASLSPGGSVAACGLVGGSKLNTTVFPFILRGVNLLGINSVYCQLPQRLEVWQRLEQDLPLDLLELMTQVAPLAEVLALSRQILDGQILGRVVVDVNA